jgi:hypothetical protein
MKMIIKNCSSFYLYDTIKDTAVALTGNYGGKLYKKVGDRRLDEINFRRVRREYEPCPVPW